MKSIQSFFTILIISSSLTSCGYQLRGSADLVGLEEISVVSNGYTSISELLIKKLGSAHNSNSDTYPTVKILSISSKKRQLSVNSSGRVDEYEVSKSLIMNFYYLKKSKIKNTIKASASYDFNESSKCKEQKSER